MRCAAPFVPFLPFALFFAGCGASRPVAPTPVTAPVATPAIAIPERSPLARCAEYDTLDVEAYWTQPKDGKAWVRIESSGTGQRAPYGEPAVGGCETTQPFGDPHRAIRVLCLPAEGAREIVVRAELDCHLGAGHRTVTAVVSLPASTKPAERLPVRVEALPPTAPEERNGGSELSVWRARHEAPPWVRAQIPADFDFTRWMLAGPDSPRDRTVAIGIEAPTQTPTRAKHVLIVDFRYPEPDCPPCQGIRNLQSLAVPPPAPTRIWLLPREESAAVKVFLREHVPLCPPCNAP